MSAEREYPWLAQHRIAKPCKVKWSDMSGTEKVRHCGQCRLNVYNLSAMKADEAEGLLKKNNGKICTYFYQRTDGTVLTQDCPVGVRQVLRNRGLIGAVVYAASLLLGLPTGRADGFPAKGEPQPAQMLGGAPVAIPTMGEPSVAPSPAPSPAPKKSPCPLPLMGRPALPPKNSK
jgi:hypothetical protein